MTYASFNNQCTILGDQSLPINERWKSIKYINTTGQAAPMCDAQYLLKCGRLIFDTNGVDTCGFIILEPSATANAKEASVHAEIIHTDNGDTLIIDNVIETTINGELFAESTSFDCTYINVEKIVSLSFVNTLDDLTDIEDRITANSTYLISNS